MRMTGPGNTQPSPGDGQGRGFYYQENRGEDLFMLAPEPYLVTDVYGTISHANLAAQAFLGADRVALDRKPIQVFIKEGPRRRSFRTLLTSMIPSDTVVIETLIKPYGREARHVVLSGVKVTDYTQGERILWLLRDQTDRIAAEEEVRRVNEDLERRVEERTRDLQAANNAKDEFLGLMSHELRTPLTIVLGNARILKNRAEAMQIEERNQALSDMVQEAERLQRLIENLMTLARLDVQKPKEAEPVHLPRLIEGLLESVFAAGRDSIQLQISEDLPLVKGVPVYLEQVLHNLVANAFKYAGSGPIELYAEARTEAVMVSVRDHGHGVDPEDIPKLFEPFFRGTPGEGGLPGAGVGLTVCRRLIEAQGGRIWIESFGTEGTAFRFTAPHWTFEGEDC